MRWTPRTTTSRSDVEEAPSDSRRPVDPHDGSPVVVHPVGTGTLTELARLFLRLGLIGFGGPAAHVALMEREIVRQRGWLSHDEFLDLVGATNLIPGPNSTELAMHIGHRRAGWRGLVVAGAAFILPAALLVGVIAWAYVRFGAMPAVTGVLRGVAPVMLAIVAQAIWLLGRSALRDAVSWALLLAAIVVGALGAHELVVLAGAAAAMLAIRMAPRSATPRATVLPLLLPLGWAFFKIGALLFGSGYVLLAFLRAEFVVRLGWLTETQLLDAIVVGQVTPGPVFTTATFVGYLVGGPVAAIAATFAIFLPAFVLVAVTAPHLGRLRRSAVWSAALDGVNVASLALMVVVTWHLGRSALVDGPSIVLGLLGAALLLWRRTTPTAVVALGAAIGLLRALF